MSVPATNWMDRAACLNADPDLFHAPDKERPAAGELREAAARAVCARCPVTGPCLDRAFALGDKHSFAGGLNPEERKNLKRRAVKRSWRRRTDGSPTRNELAAARRAEVAATGMQTCAGPCGLPKPVGEFTLTSGGRRRPECKECRSAARTRKASSHETEGEAA